MSQSNVDPRAIGWTWFAAVMMWLTGLFQIFAGLVGIVSDDFYPEVEHLFRLNAETWGWIQMVTGFVVFFAGAALLSAQFWARVLAVIMAAVSVLESFVFLPSAPVWSAIVIFAGAMVIWALTVHGHDIESAGAD